MILKELKDAINSIPTKEDNRNVSFAGSLIDGNNCIDEIEVSWIDCSDAMLILLNKKEDTNNN